jgi:hypothetical protein
LDDLADGELEVDLQGAGDDVIGMSGEPNGVHPFPDRRGSVFRQKFEKFDFLERYKPLGYAVWISCRVFLGIIRTKNHLNMKRVFRHLQLKCRKLSLFLRLG